MEKYRDIADIASELFNHPDFVVGNVFTREHFDGFNDAEIDLMRDDGSIFADVISQEVFEMAESYRKT